LLALRSSPDGLYRVSSSSGSGEFELVFDGGFAEKAGIALSVVSIAAATGFAVAGFWERRGHQ
jgi:hypothetical protein